MPFGWVGRILYVDLTHRSVHTEETEKYLDFIGGRGINQWLLFNLSGKGVDPLDERSPIILGSGPFIGTLAPAANRLSVDFKNAVTGGVGSGNCGGHFAAEMKYAGYDHIVISGRAASPTYLYVTDNQVYFRDAAPLWGKDTWETENAIKQMEGSRRIKTLSIGAGGENLVRFACLIADRGRAAAYGGAGAVFGSKNLKAIAVRGSLPVEIAHPDRIIDKLAAFSRDVIEKSHFVVTHREGGTLRPYQAAGENRPHGVRNMSDEFWPDECISDVSRTVLEDNYLLRRHSCFNCPVYCSSIFEVNGVRCEGLQANSFRGFASNLDLRSPEKVLYLNALTNLHGLDGDHTSAVVAWATECYENGILGRSDTDGLDLRWGNGDAMIQLVENIAHRRGFGDVLAGGLYEACKTVGGGSEKYAVLVKKNSLMEQGMRSHKGWALGIVTSTKGGGHLRGACCLESQGMSPEMSKRLLDIDDIQDPTSYEHKAELVVWQEKYKGIIDMMGLCVLPTMWVDVNLYKLEDIVEFYSIITGRESSPEELLNAGSRLQNLERAFNVIHAGFGRGDDMPPRKLCELPVSRGSFKGEKLDLERWGEMLDEYYALHGWDPLTGWPTRKNLEELGLQRVVEVAANHNVELI